VRPFKVMSPVTLSPSLNRPQKEKRGVPSEKGQGEDGEKMIQPKKESTSRAVQELERTLNWM